MILQSLNDYYHRKCADPDPRERLPDFGFEQKEIPFVLEIAAGGTPVQLLDTRTANDKKKLIARSYRVPQGIKKTSGVAANLLWDTVEYALGIDTKGKPERVVEQHAAFRQRLQQLPADVREDAGVAAVNRFLNQINVQQLEVFAAWPQALESNALVSFKLQGDVELVCQRPAVVRAAQSAAGADDAPQAMCLVTGEHAPIERLHAAIKGVWGAQTSGANVVSFNARAFESYGKTERQGENAPVSQAAAFAYTTALNHLLRRDSRQRVQVGDASTVFWADKPTDFEEFIPGLFSDNPDAGADAVRALYQAIHTGQWGGADGDTVMHVLGLAPNAARISVRFYHHKPLKELGRDIQQHFDDLEMARGPNDAQYPSLFRLLAAVSVQNKADNIPPNLGGSIVDAIFSGPEAPYPALWLNAAVGRCRAEQNVNYLRAAAIKACLNRNIRSRRSSLTNDKEFLPMLDNDNKIPAYRMGRLFAVLERIQEQSAGGIGVLNSTIRDRYYGAASSTPGTVFPTLLKLKNHHVSKLDEKGSRILYRAFADNRPDDYIGQITLFVDAIPTHLSLPQQGHFALGYYHQRQSFFSKKSDSTDGATKPDSTNPNPSGE